MKNQTDSRPKQIRFPEFRDKPKWAERRLSEVLFEHNEKSSGAEEVYSVSVHKGVVNQIEHLGRSFSASNTDHYKRVNNGDVIYTKSPTGDFPYGIIKQSKVGKPVIVSPLYGVFKPETIALGTILDAYFEYRENVINYLSSIIQKGAKNTINIRNDVFLSKTLPLPTDPTEQQKIADCLSSLDELITAHSAQLEALKAHKKGLLQQLFPAEGETVPRLRFPEFQDSGEWEEKSFGDLFQIGSGRDYKHLGEGNIPVYGSGGLMLYVNDFLYDGESVCIGRKGTIDKPMFLTGKFWTVDTLFYTHSFGENIPKFIYLVFQNINWFNHNEAGGIPSLSKTTINAIEVKVPKPKEQQKIANCLSSVDELIINQTEKIVQLKLHKKGLIQGLFPNINELKS